MTTPANSDDDQRLIPLPLSILAVISVVVHVALLCILCFAAKSSAHDGFPAAEHAWNWYLVIGAAWSVGIGVFGLCWGRRATTRFGGGGSSARVGWCLAGVWLGYFWPVPATVAMVAFVAIAVRPRQRAGARIVARTAAVVAAVPVAIAGSAWGLWAHAAQLHQVSKASSSSVVGTWRAGGMTVTLHPDGTYSASDLTAANLSYDNTAYPPGTGRWDLDASVPDELDSVELRPSQDRLLELPVYRASSVDYLCAEIDPDSPCDIVFHRE